MAYARDCVRLTGQFYEILKRVDNCSLDVDDVRPALQAIIEGRFVTEALEFNQFATVKDQIENVRKWNYERQWGFTDEDFAQVSADAEHLGRARGGTHIAWVLVPYLGNEERTFLQLWDIAAQYHAGIRWEFPRGVKLDKAFFGEVESITLIEGNVHRPGLRWELLRLDGLRGHYPKDMSDQKSAHAGILACAAHSPEWIRAMDGEASQPFVYLCGYRFFNHATNGLLVPRLGTDLSDPSKLILVLKFVPTGAYEDNTACPRIEQIGPDEEVTTDDGDTDILRAGDGL